MAGRRWAAGRAAGTVLALAVGVGLAVLPAAPAFADGITSMSAGDYHTCFVHGPVDDVWCWGANSHGQLGDGTTTNRAVPVAVDTSGVLHNLAVDQVAAGALSTCALGTNGLVYCWGSNAHGQLGDGTTTDRLSPVAVDLGGLPGGTTFIQLAVGADSACAVTGLGTVYCWGDNSHGQLGDGTTTNRLTPVPVSFGPTTVAQISVGDELACAVSSTNAGYCWGANDVGQVGDGTTTERHSPTSITFGGTVDRITAGFRGACLLSSGAAYCWGANTDGEVGDGTTTGRLTPTAVDVTGVLASVTLTRISAPADGRHACALGSTGAVYCWGNGVEGELGDATTTSSSSPVAVSTGGVLNGVTLYDVSMGASHSCATTWRGTALYCWGANTSGGLGDGTTTTRTSPVRVLFGAAPATGVYANPGNQSAAVHWTGPVSLGAGTFVRYTATSSPGNHTCTSTVLSTTTCPVSGLTNGTPYTFTVVVTTSVGNSPTSDPSVAVTPADVPDVPTGVTAVPGGAQATVSWTAPDSFGSGSFTSYTVTSDPGGLVCTTSTSTDTGCTVTGLTNGTAYTFTVVATTSLGSSGASDASPPVTPGAPVAPGAVPGTVGGSLVSSAGDQFTRTARRTTLTGTGFAARTPVVVAVYSTPAVLAHVVTDGSGAFSVTVTVPSGFTGTHTFLATGFGAGGVPRTLTLPITVRATGGLAATGLPVVTTVVLGLGVLAGGLLVLLANRRRRA